MDSPLEKLFNNLSNKLSPKIYKLTEKPPEPAGITTIGLLANLFAINSLKEKSILMCIFYSIIGLYCGNLDSFYAKKYKMKSTIWKSYSHLVDNIKILGLIYLVFIIYKDKISNTVINIFIILALLSNINYAIKIRIKNIDNIPYDKQLEPWNYLGMLIGDKKKLKKVSKITRFFDDSMIFVYFLISILYFHYF